MIASLLSSFNKNAYLVSVVFHKMRILWRAGETSKAFQFILTWSETDRHVKKINKNRKKIISVSDKFYEENKRVMRSQ